VAPIEDLNGDAQPLHSTADAVSGFLIVFWSFGPSQSGAGRSGLTEVIERLTFKPSRS